MDFDNKAQQLHQVAGGCSCGADGLLCLQVFLHCKGKQLLGLGKLLGQAVGSLFLFVSWLFVPAGVMYQSVHLMQQPLYLWWSVGTNFSEHVL